MLPPWTSLYVGIPYDPHGVNCWGLVCLVYRQQFGISLPTYADGPDAIDVLAVREAMQRERASMEADDWRSVAVPTPGDVALFRRGRLPAHVGIVVAPGQMLHTMVGMDAALARLDSAEWAPRLLGFFRHRDIDHGL